MKKKTRDLFVKPYKRLRGARRLVEVYVLASVVLIALMLFGYTHLLVNQLREEVRKTSKAYVTYQTLVASEIYSPDLAMVIIGLSQEIGRTMNFPSIVTDAEGNPMAWSQYYVKKLGKNPDENTELLKEFAADLDKENEPLPIVRYSYNPETGHPVSQVFGYFHYGEPRIIKLLYWVPLLQLVLIGTFAFLGLLTYRRLKSAETQAVWAGLARETAHQLGTPISSLIGWHELLREKCEGSPQAEEPLYQMHVDIARLEKIAARFQEIGAPVALVQDDLVPIIERAVDYGLRRVPQMSGIKISADTPTELYARHNPLLFEWVLENLIKNAVDALVVESGDGHIRVRLSQADRYVLLRVADDGPGIDAADVKRIFTPGFTTKAKGWGLGLALVRRIVYEIHGGKIEVKSEGRKGTEFLIYLPKK
ncbi:MAG: HAMP domain-containing histidine kinase [bacterium]|nr:HAMP domain-containing histidine kinase [bacterium]